MKLHRNNDCWGMYHMVLLQKRPIIHGKR